MAQTNKKLEPSTPREFTLSQHGQAPLRLTISIHSDFESIKSDWITFEKTAISTPFQIWAAVLNTLPQTDIVSLTKQPEALGKTKNPMAWVCPKDYYTPNSYQMSLTGYDDWHDLLSTKRSGKVITLANDPIGMQNTSRA